MEKQTDVVCVYAKEGRDAGEIILESFRLFLQKELQNPELVTKSVWHM